MLDDITRDMTEAAAKVEPLVQHFTSHIATELNRLQQIDAPLESPLTDHTQADTIRRIRSAVEGFERAMGEIHQKLVLDAQRIALNWILPGDVQAERAKMEDFSHHAHA